MQKSAVFIKKNVKMNMWKIKNIVKIEIIAIIQRNIEVGAQHSVCNLKYSVPKKIFVAFHNGSNYDYLFTMTESVEELKQSIYLLIHNFYSSNTKRSYRNW